MNRKRVYLQKKDPYSSHVIISKIISDNKNINTKILDLGCDIGFLGFTLSKLNRDFVIHGVDINKENLKIAKGHYEKTYVFDLNTKTWPISGKYEVVVLADTLEHLTNPKKVLSNVYKLLKKNGLLIVSVPNIVFWWSRLLIMVGRFPKHKRGIFDKTHLHCFTRQTLENLLTLNKFKIESFHTTNFPLQFIFNKKKLNLPLRIIYDFNYLLSVIWPNLFSYQIILVVSKD